MAWSSPKTWAVGDVLTAADMNTYVRDNTAFLHDTGIKTDAGHGTLSFSAADENLRGYAPIGTADVSDLGGIASGYWTAPTTGTYHFTFQLADFSVGSDTVAAVWALKNGTTRLGWGTSSLVSRGVSGADGIQASGIEKLNGGDSLQVYAWCLDGGSCTARIWVARLSTIY